MNGMKALIKVGYGCNKNCTFCHTLDVRHIDGDSEEVERDKEEDRSRCRGAWAHHHGPCSPAAR